MAQVACAGGLPDRGPPLRREGRDLEGRVGAGIAHMGAHMGRDIGGRDALCGDLVPRFGPEPARGFRDRAEHGRVERRLDRGLAQGRISARPMP
jgi:hypothetical protein